MSDLPKKAEIRYLMPDGTRPIYIASDGGANAALNIQAKFENITVELFNAREFGNQFSLDVQGFELHEHSSSIPDFYAIQENEFKYVEELKELVLPATGGKSLFVFDHTLRSDSPQIRDRYSIREAAAIAHNDYTDASARKRIKDLMPATQTNTLFKSRFAIVNVWRSIAGPVITSPLTCCDAQTVSEDEIHASERRAKGRIGELELVSYSSKHRWYYYPEMTKNEVLMIKTYDSESKVRAKRSVHTAFKNSLAPENAQPRQSIESRMFVFF